MTNQQGAPEALTDPSPDQLRAIARTARDSSGSASDDCGPLAYVLHGWRAAVIAFRAQQPAPSAAAAGQRRSDLVPGVMHCAKCKFQLNRVTLCVSDGNAYAGNNETEPCPNGCGPLWPVTWEQEARNCWKALEEMHERLHPAPTPQADSRPAPVEVADAMADSQYLAGVSAGWNAANADDPNAALQKLQESRAGYLKPLRAARAPADSGAAPAAGAVAGPALAPSAFVNAAGIKADDKPGTVVRKLDAAFHDAVTFADAAMHGGALWCVNIQGPDDVIAMPSKSAALEHANDLNALFGRHPYEEGDPIMRAVVIEWPHSADSHAADLVIQDATHGAAPTPPSQAADSVLDRARIREIFMAHGFTVKEGQTDLKQYVYDAADALLDAARKQGGAA